ncbi:Pleckstrin homology domain-containing family O member 2 [Camelus dromedarius]|uniref:Pleckstrin homology domain-containing family O member 2 n=1 Tax=Camelus dromedarius TaxID=9838 RepID=A0A5N4E3K8_CAMDR|nr:pleckstrin homology domain-containing family O member 2 [Camelus dromedarius]KAB1278021.1 Pleckstrin homology domain-containing family O member 2 [Camelus dromedarius]
MEEEGVKEGGEKPRGAQTADKAGWIKKSSGGFLGLWKDRYLLLCQAQLLVYENEDEQKCVETVELGSYEKCQDLRALLKRKHRFILLRSPGNKVSDIKFQAPSGEEKESWIKALNEGINRGKNKAFDEVKVDKSCALEHVTRDRVRGGMRRRPPTRVHLKEVANAASDGLSRLDLDVPDSGPPVFAPSDDVSAAQPRERLQPPMPPTKPSPASEMTSLGDSVETPAGERAPTPVPASSEAHPESQEDSETPVGKDSGSEQPPNKVLPDKLKVSWENPSAEESPDRKSAELSQLPCSETSEAISREGGKPPTPPPKILSEKLRASMSGVEASGPAQSPRASETSAPAPAQVSVNGVDDISEPVKPSQATGTPGTPPHDAATSTALPPWDPQPRFHPRCSSLGDLLGEGPRRPWQPREQLYQAQLEVKVASEQTEKLLKKVLGSEPAPVNAESLLSQAVEQLRQATQVLQEMRDLGELSQGEPGLREKRKELVTLYRRSAP